MPGKNRWSDQSLPPLDDDFLGFVLTHCGPVESNGMGAVAISPQRLESWCRLTAYTLTPWQAETVLDMSGAYASVFTDEKAPMPWQGDDAKFALSMAMKARAKAARNV